MSAASSDIDLYALVGQPVAGLRSPGLFRQSLSERGMGGTMVPLDIAPENLAAAIAGFRALGNLRGFLVTMPHKQTIAPLLDGLTPAARITGAVNIVRRTPDGRLIGGQLDGPGFVAGLRLAGFAPEGAQVHMAGAGGVAAGIAYALAEAGVARIAIFNRTRARAQELCTKLAPHFAGCTFVVGEQAPDDSFDLAVNATSVGLMGESALPFEIAGLKAGAMVADVVNRADPTALERAAGEKGLVFVAGRGMVVPQLPMMHDFFAAADD